MKMGRWAAVVLGMAIAGPASAAPGSGDLAKALGMAVDAAGMVTNACDEAVAPMVTPIDLGGDLAAALLLVIPGGPQTLTCYGDVPGDMYLMVAEGEGYRTVFQGGGFIMVLPEQHGGVHDFALGGPGLEFPVHVWTGKDYAQKGSITNDALGALGDVPMYP